MLSLRHVHAAWHIACMLLTLFHKRLTGRQLLQVGGIELGHVLSGRVLDSAKCARGEVREVNHLQVRRLWQRCMYMHRCAMGIRCAAPALHTHSILKALRRAASGSGPANCITRTNVPPSAVECSSTRMRVKPAEGSRAPGC